MINSTEFWSVFAYDGTPIRKADPRELGGRVPNKSARRILIETGLPEQLGYELSFFAIHKQPMTLGEFRRQRQISEMTEVDDCLMIGADSDEGIIALDGSSGRMYSWQNNKKLLINSTLGNFTEFLRLIRDSMNEVERNPSMSDTGQLFDPTEHLMKRFEIIDPTGMERARGYWSDITKRIFTDE
ncbi:SUKH-4 family immunity protein [Streptomyces niveus]|uniref:SUKH-4 family immunity protein n=1 Tax=Streptomyces niveus TaxID=193462 RepID=UPI0036491775